MQLAERARLFVPGELAARPVAGDGDALDQRHLRQEPARHAPGPARDLRAGGVQQLVPQDGMRRGSVVGVDLA